MTTLAQSEDPKDPGPIMPPKGLNEMSREMLIDCIHRLVAGMNQLRSIILANSTRKPTHPISTGGDGK